MSGEPWENIIILASAYGPLHTGVIPGRYAKIKVRCILWCWSRIDDNEEGGKSWDGMEKHYLEMLNVDDNVKRRVILISIFVEGKKIKVFL